jgi:hypothetical protein
MLCRTLNVLKQQLHRLQLENKQLHKQLGDDSPTAESFDIADLTQIHRLIGNFLEFRVIDVVLGPKTAEDAESQFLPSIIIGYLPHVTPVSLVDASGCSRDIFTNQGMQQSPFGLMGQDPMQFIQNTSTTGIFQGLRIELKPPTEGETAHQSNFADKMPGTAIGIYGSSEGVAAREIVIAPDETVTFKADGFCGVLIACSAEGGMLTVCKFHGVWAGKDTSGLASDVLEKTKKTCRAALVKPLPSPAVGR